MSEFLCLGVLGVLFTVWLALEIATCVAQARAVRGRRQREEKGGQGT